MLDCIQMVQLKKDSSEYVQYLKSFRTLPKWQSKFFLWIVHINHLRARKWLMKATSLHDTLGKFDF